MSVVESNKHWLGPKHPKKGLTNDHQHPASKRVAPPYSRYSVSKISSSQILSSPLHCLVDILTRFVFLFASHSALRSLLYGADWTRILQALFRHRGCWEGPCVWRVPCRRPRQAVAPISMVLVVEQLSQTIWFICKWWPSWHWESL
jgi:hypothetical protein